MVFRIGEELVYKLRFEVYRDYPAEPTDDEWLAMSETRLDDIEGQLKERLDGLFPKGFDLTIQSSNICQYCEVREE